MSQLMKNQDSSFNKNVRYSTTSDFNIFSAQLNKSRGSVSLEVSRTEPKLQRRVCRNFDRNGVIPDKQPPQILNQKRMSVSVVPTTILEENESEPIKQTNPVSVDLKIKSAIQTAPKPDKSSRQIRFANTVQASVERTDPDVTARKIEDRNRKVTATEFPTAQKRQKRQKRKDFSALLEDPEVSDEDDKNKRMMTQTKKLIKKLKLKPNPNESIYS